MKSVTEFFNSMSVSKGIFLLLAPIITVIVSMKEALVGLLILIMIDLITGIRKHHHIEGVSFKPNKKVFWTSIKSYMLRQTWRKAYEYGIGVIVVVVFETLVFATPFSITLADRSFTLTELLTVVPALIEVWSIFENLEAVSGKNVFKRLKFLLPLQIREFFNNDKKPEDEK